MDKELQEQLLEALKSTMGTIGDIKDFTIEQIPDVLQQVLAWYGVYYFVLFLIAIITTTIIYKIFRKLIIKHQDENEMIAAALTTGTVAILINSIFLNLQWLKIWIAPKLWLLEYLRDIAKG